MISTPKRLSDKIKPWIVKAIKDHPIEGPVLWEVATMVFPDPTKPIEDSYAALPTLVLYLEIPTGNPDFPSVYGAAILAPYNLTESQVVASVESSLNALVLAKNTPRDQHNIKDEMLALDI